MADQKSITEYAPCPKCGGVKAKKIGYTWWGGAVGPKLYNHVKCESCGTAYKWEDRPVEYKQHRHLHHRVDGDRRGHLLFVDDDDVEFLVASVGWLFLDYNHRKNNPITAREGRARKGTQRITESYPLEGLGG